MSCVFLLQKKQKKDQQHAASLPDDVLILVLQRLDLRTAVRAGAAARRWRPLPRLLTAPKSLLKPSL